MKQYRHIAYFLLTLLLLTGVANEAWAAKVTYHILTLPINSTTANMSSAVNGKRLEAVKVVVDNQSVVGLPDHYKSPLAKNFKYYKLEGITVGSTVQIYDNNDITKGTLYQVKGENTPENDTDDATPVGEGTTISGSTAEYFVVYEYDSDNSIAKLNGLVKYNIGIKNKGFLSYNRGRNNRPAVVPTAKVEPEMLINQDFIKINSPGGGITTYWQSGDNKNTKAEVESQFHFIFQFEGLDPYNIIIRAAYNRDYTYIEKNDDTKDFVYKWYKGGSLFAIQNANAYIASDEHKKYNIGYDTSKYPTNPTELSEGDGNGYNLRPGHFHGQTSGPVWNSFAILNNSNSSGYVFMATRTVDKNGTMPTPSNNKYNYLKFDNNNLTIGLQTETEVSNNYSTEGVYAIKDINFKVVTPFGNTVSESIKLSEYVLNSRDISTDDIPTELIRKYCNFTGKFYKSSTFTEENEIEKYSEATTDGGTTYNVYVGYEVSSTIPFKAITPADSYTADTWRSATWYELTDKDATTDKKIKYDGTTYFKNNGVSTTYEKVSEYAFLGDPYELRVISRSLTQAPSNTTYSPYFVGATGDTPASGTAFTASTSATAGYQWEIPSDATGGSFLLRKFNDEGHWYWNTEGTNQNVEYSTASSTRVRVLSLPEREFTYKVVDKAGNIAVTATVSETIFSPLDGYANIPEVIRSPFLADETVTFYSTFDSGSGAGTGTSRTHLSNLITELTAGDPENSTIVYVKYTTSHLDEKSIKLNGDNINQQFNVKLNGSYIYYDAVADKIKSNESPTADELAKDPYLWYLRGRDPYAMLIDNIEARTDLSVSGTEEVTMYDDDGNLITPTPIKDKGAWVQVFEGSWDDDKAIVFTATRSNASRFVAMLSNDAGVYEVLAATGDDTYYHIGRATGTDTDTKIYSIETPGYAHGDAPLRFELAGKETIFYHLIDKAGNELFEDEIMSNNPRLTLPAAYVSPLVGTYYYYPTKELAEADVTTGNHSGNITEPDQITDEGNNVWVTYTVNNIVKFNDTNSSYLLKFLHPFDAGYYLEDGNDKLTTTKIQAVYPYTNGDGSLNVYGTAMNEEQMNGGSSTRSRWVWFFESKNDDPYHVMIHSSNKITYKDVGHPTYLQTYAVHFKQDTGEDEDKLRVVTGGILPGIASITPTEYMILGTKGNYKLLTTDKINDGESNIRRTVTSFEQYWKTYNMIKLHLLGIDKKTDAFSNDQTTWVVPDDRRTALKTKLGTLQNTATDGSSDLSAKIGALTSKGIYYFRIGTTAPYTYKKVTVVNIPATEFGVDYTIENSTKDDWEGLYYVDGSIWHSYDVIANAVRWNGYNDKSDGHEKKVVEKLEHWFQTFDMGDGSFDIESAIIPPVLVLLDRHGWEIMRKPLPKKETYPNGDELTALKAYDSPMVKEYKFYNNATKGTGCHKYVLRMQNGAERDQIKDDNGKHFTSKSLADLPDINYSGVLSGGAIQDFFVTYTVKEEYENSYKYHLELHEEDSTFTESGTPSKFLMLQNGRYSRDEINATKSYLSKPVSEGTNPTGGNVYDMIISPSQVVVGNVIVDTNKDGKIDDNNLWYVGPNLRIDEEMGIKWAEVKNASLEPHTEYEMKKEYKDKTGFDPYNIQLKNVSTGTFMTSHMTSASRGNGVLKGEYTGIDYYGYAGSTNITLETEFTSYNTSVDKGSEGYDHTNLQISNQTFMAVSDANGNMQLMPRFDHDMRLNVSNLEAESRLTTLQPSIDHAKASVDNNESMGPQTTFFVRPQVIEYHIIDNDGNEALRYKRAGDYKPAITEHFKSPLASDFKFYYDHAVYSSSASDKASYSAAASSTAFQKTATSDENMTDQAKLLEVLDDYYFKVTTDKYKYVKVTVKTAKSGSADAVYTTEASDADAYGGSSLTATDDAALETAAKAYESTGVFYYKVGPLYDYKKVTVTKAHSGSTDATYTTTNCTETEWSNAVAYQKSKTDEAAMQTEILSLGAKGLYYYQLGTGHYAYKEVVRADGKNTITISDIDAWNGATGDYKRTATDEDAFETEAETLSSGSYYYKIGPLYNYQKVVVTNVASNIISKIAAKKDISDKEITGSLADAGLNDDTNDVYVRYSYNESADGDEILKGKWFTIKLANKDVKCGDSDAINTADGTGVSLLQGTSKPSTIDADDEVWQWKFLAAPMDPESEYYEPADPYAIELYNRKANYSATLDEPNPMSVPIKINGTNRFALLSHPNGDGYALAVSGSGYAYKFLDGTNMTTGVPATTYPENRQKITVVDDEEYETVKAKLSIDGEYYFKISGTVSYMKVTVSGAPGEISRVVDDSQDYKSNWNGADNNHKKTATDEDFETKRNALNINGDYYFRITTNSVSYKKVIVTSGTPDSGADSNVSEWTAGDTYHFNIKSNALPAGTKLILNNDVTHEYTYKVINNAGTLAVSDIQTDAEADSHDYAPYLPDNIQSLLLNLKDYKYYGNVTGTGPYEVVEKTKLHTLYGLYKDEVYVRYGEYNPDNAGYLVPNQKAIVDSHVARGDGSQDVALNIKGELPYNIIWYSDNMMKAVDTTEPADGVYDAISSDASHALDGAAAYVWLFEGEDPYALKIKHKSSGKYIYSSDNATCALDGTDATLFMLLNKDGYDDGVLQVTGGTNMLSGNGNTLVGSSPTKFIIFGLSTHKVIYHLVIAKSCANQALPNDGEYVEIPYREGDETRYSTSYEWTGTEKKRIFGTTQRDLTSSIFGVPGDRYQLGSTILGQTYSVDAGEVSIGDVLKVPEEFERPNTLYFFYVDNVQTKGNTSTYQKTVDSESAMNTEAASLAAEGNYYYKITGQNIYRKVHVTEVSPVAYEISGSTEAAYTAVTTNYFKKESASTDAMETAAKELTVVDDYYFKVGAESPYTYNKVTVTKAHSGSDDAIYTIVTCTKADWENAVATKKADVMSNETAMITDVNAIASVGDYYYKVGTVDLYKRVQVTDVSSSVEYNVVDCTEDDWTNVWQDNSDLNKKYKGLEITKLMSDADLIGGLVKINVAYAFETGLETNAGEGFVTSVAQNLWYTFETSDKKTPYLAHYTNAWGLQAMAGRDTRYTNDYLWTPLGDVYGFKMYNRYMIKNSGGVSNLMTMPTITEGTNLKLAVPGSDGIPQGYEVFELLAPSITSGSFKIHPVVNKVGTQYFIKRHNADTDVNSDGKSDLNYAIISTDNSEWTFNLTPELLKPYVDRVGYLGGLTKDAYTKNKTILDKVKNGTAGYAEMLTVQGIVYDDENIVPYTPGYYRLHNQPDVSDISLVRYASGYLHDIEKTAVSGGIPMHFYSKKGTSTTFGSSGLKKGYTKTIATRGDIPVPATEYDPSTIFYINGGVNSSDLLDKVNPRVTMSTQGLYVKGVAADENGDDDDHDHGDAVMTASSVEATTFSLMDIGGAVFLIHDGTLPATRRYLNFSQDYEKTIDETEVNMIYDLKYFHNSPTDDAKWCIVPADSLMVTTNNGGDDYYYTTFCVPYDVQLPNDNGTKTYYAYTCDRWDEKNLHPTKVPEVTGETAYDAGKFVPAGTPVIIRIKDESGSMKLTLPNYAPTTISEESPLKKNIFSGQYLEQSLPLDEGNKWLYDVYTLGLPFKSDVHKDGDYNETGDVTAELAEQDKEGVGFYINATPNKENDELQSLWLRNNRYVLHNKIYYREGATPGASAPQRRGPEFVPVIFDDEEGEQQDEELRPDGTREVIGDGCVYDLMGRKVATREQVEDGSWKQRVATGIYIINGKKIRR